jgi:hypothetical protein
VPPRAISVVTELDEPLQIPKKPRAARIRLQKIREAERRQALLLQQQQQPDDNVSSRVDMPPQQQGFKQRRRLTDDG